MAERGPGRPPKSDEQLAAEQEIKDAVIESVSAGETLTACCEKHKIGTTTWYRWMGDDGELAGRFARARELGFDAIADKALEIADDKESDPDAASRRIRADVRLKLLAKWDPKRYGDAVQLKHADADGDKLDVGGPIAVAMRAAALLKQAIERDTDDGQIQGP